MRVLFLIPKNSPPELEGAFSKSFKEFVSLCLFKNPEERLPAKELLKHKFIKSAKKNSMLMDIIDRYSRYKETFESEEPLEQDLRKESKQFTDGSIKWDFDTVKFSTTGGKKDGIAFPTIKLPKMSGVTSRLDTLKVAADDEEQQKPLSDFFTGIINPAIENLRQSHANDTNLISETLKSLSKSLESLDRHGPALLHSFLNDICCKYSKRYPLALSNAKMKEKVEMNDIQNSDNLASDYLLKRWVMNERKGI
jgi:serine/threonine-protein kinase 24/25/MST4